MNPMNFFTRFTRLKGRGSAVTRIARAFRVFGPMCADVARGRYRPIPWSAFMWMLLAVAYLLSPLDLIPDFIMFFGIIDDIFIVGWLLTRVDNSLRDYRLWKGIDVADASDSSDNQQ